MFTGEGGDAAQALLEVQRHAFAGEQRARLAANGGQDIARGRPFAAVHMDSEEIDTAQLREDQLDQLHAADGHGLARNEAAGGHEIGVDSGVGGEVAGANVLGERAANRVDYFGVVNVEIHYISSSASLLFSNCAL